jgi:hypothetical protein
VAPEDGRGTQVRIQVSQINATINQCTANGLTNNLLVLLCLYISSRCFASITLQYNLFIF